jgi:hypothetical protein
MPRVGFESKTPMFERTKMVYNLHPAATVIGNHKVYYFKLMYFDTENETQKLSVLRQNVL